MRTTLKIVLLCSVGLAAMHFPRAKRYCEHSGHVAWTVVNSDVTSLLSISYDDGTARIHNLNSRAEVLIRSQDIERIRTAAFSPCGKIVVGGGKGQDVVGWNVSDGSEAYRLGGHETGVVAVAFSPNGKTLVTADEKQTVRFWDHESRRELRSFRPKCELITSVAFHPEGEELGVACWMGKGSTIEFRLVESGKLTRSLNKPEGHVRRIVFSPDGKILCSADRDLCLWDNVTGHMRECECPEWFDDGDYANTLVFSPDGTVLAAGHDSAIGLWDVASGKNTIAFTGGKGNPYLNFSDRLLLDPTGRRFPTLTAATFKKNGDLMVVGVLHKNIALWRLTSVAAKK